MIRPIHYKQMKEAVTMKYVLLIIAGILLWLTTPFWMIDHSTVPSESKIDNYIEKKNEEATKLSARETEALRKYVEKFGEKPKVRYKTGTPLLVRNYWQKHFKHPDAVVERRCSPLKRSDRGWMTVCEYRAKEDSAGLSIYQDVYYINKGIVSK
ncbi:hypothetical protein [Sulfurovum sp.]|uniref:hypothetical protein n=1 Tax=Sulfurovum sp. TaxID=1969726 RepID=UPI0025D432D2|nr:hypothetical protein [Sulfurovum sp.]